MDGEDMLSEARVKSLGKRVSPCYRLRNVMSCFCFTLCVVSMVFWIHSYNSYAFISGCPTNTQFDSIISWNGRVRLNSFGVAERLKRNPGLLPKIKGGFIPTDKWRLLASRRGRKSPPDFLGFHIDIGKSWKLSIPHWFFAAVTGAVATALRPSPRLRFSIRSLLLAVTLVAVVLGAITIAARIFPAEITA